MNADLTLQLNDLPTATLNAVLNALQQPTGTAAAGVIVYRLKGTTVGEITVRDTETTLTAKVTALDSEGHETSFDEMPTWASNDETVATVTPSADGYTATFEIGAPGTAAITVTGAETSSGEPVEIISTGLITVTAGDAVVGSVDFELSS